MCWRPATTAILHSWLTQPVHLPDIILQFVHPDNHHICNAQNP